MTQADSREVLKKKQETTIPIRTKPYQWRKKKISAKRVVLPFLII